MSDDFGLTADILLKSIWSWGPANSPALANSLIFSRDGTIQGYYNWNELRWTMQDGILYLLNGSGDIVWKFTAILQKSKKLLLLSYPHTDENWFDVFVLETQLNDINLLNKKTNIPPEGKVEGIRLVIWDLDDTFWNGTLSEGVIQPIQKNIDIVRELNKRGIMNALCSRNTFEVAKTKLEELGIWEEFVFPKISWGPKGPQIKDIIEKIQLRPETCIFIDDNETNLNEALHFVENIQIANPSILDNIFDDKRFKGENDSDLTRLQRYKVLESKYVDMEKGGDDNTDFLRKSNIRISFHTNVDEQFDRVHNLVNRTNQLNFTKNRWPEDIEQARSVYKEEIRGDFGVDVGYIKVSDNYGNYGICGYFFALHNRFKHFLFSCRVMNMGVEQFVWSFLGKGEISIQGEVASTLSYPEVDWISVVKDADSDDQNQTAGKELTICVRGACDLAQTAKFMRGAGNIIEEFNYAYEGWEIVTTPRVLHLHEDLKNPTNREIISKLPGMPHNRFESSILTGAADVYVLSFSQETFHGLYRSKSTGMIIPMGSHLLPYFHPEGPTYKHNLTELSFEDIQASGMKIVTEEQWNFFCHEFEFLGGYKEDLFLEDLDYVFKRLHNAQKRVLVLGLNGSVGRDAKIIEFFAYLNGIVRRKCEDFGIPFMPAEQFVKSEADLADDGIFGGPHFKLSTYKNISDYIIKYIT